MAPAPVKKWAKLTEEEWNLVREHRTVKRGNPEEQIHWFSIAGSEEFADRVADVVNSAMEMEQNEMFDGHMSAFVMKSAHSPQIRKYQYLMLLQQLQECFGPRSDAEYQFFFGEN